ncbi:MAG: RDD family protein [Rhodanobacter sp.]
MEVWIGRDGERHGPYKEEDVQQWMRSGQVSRDDLAWYDGLADWQPLSVLFPDAVATASTATSSAEPTAPIITAPLPQTTTAALEDYAGFWKRVAAYILDAIVLYIPGMLISNMMGDAAAKAAMKDAIASAAGDPHLALAAQMHYYDVMWPAMLISGVLAWLYFAFCESSAWQATIGKLALGIRVTDMHGNRISFPRALGRYGAKIISTLLLCIGLLMVAWTRRKQGLHDLMADTLVLNGRASEFKNTPTTIHDPSDTSGNGSFSA